MSADRDQAPRLIARHGSISRAAKSVPLSYKAAPGLRTSAQNHLWGQVSRIHEGPVDAEVTLILPGARTLTAIITLGGLARLDLAPGRAVGAVFQASSVTLATFA